jgi:hypothetical protein
MYSKHALSALLLASSAFLGSAASIKNNDRTNNGRRKKLDDNSECTILVAEYLQIPGETAAPDSTIDCGFDNGMIYRIQATDSQKEVLKQKWAKKEIASGATRLNVGVGAFADETALFIPPGLDIAKNLRKGPKKNRRKLAPVTGDKPILVVKVTDSGGLARPESPAQIGDDIFGTINDPVNLKSQLYDCSHGKLNVVPGQNPDPINNPPQAAPGVIEVSIGISLTNSGNNAIHNAVTAAVNAKLGTNLGNGWESITEPYHQVMYVIEKCYVDCGWAAYAYVNAWMSVYQASYYKQVGVQVHELGHNFGFAHSGGLNGQPYTDHTGMMGNPLYSDDTGKMCYNAAKNWQIGWYDDAKILINPLAEPSTTVNLVGVADYDVRNGKPVVIKIETGAEDDYFVGFNRAIRANAQNDEADNEVTIVQVVDGNGESYSQSWLRATLIQGESFIIPNFAGTGNPLTIAATNINLASNPGVATVTFDYETGPTAAPTAAPCYSGTASVSITPDNYASETTWDIRNGANVVVASGINAIGESNIVLADGSYTFTIYDSFGDGICCAFGNGSYSLQVGSTVVKTGGEFASEESTQFGICSDVSPTAAPTQAPTVPPTNPPSPAPTSSPTIAPTSAPTTANPTASPTKSPTPNPTSAPSAAPTSPPTSSPTASPTKSPTPNPTLPPTLAPTKAPTSAPTPNPTVPPTLAPTSAPTSASTSSPTSSGGCDTVRVEILTDNYPGETSWQLTDATSAVVLSGSGYTASGTTFSSEVCVDDWTSLSFTINDAYGDGICCAYGSGSYTVTVNGNTVLSGGAFGSSETKPLQATPCDNGEETVGGEVVCKCDSDEIRITVDLTTDNYPRETTWTLSTCDGVEVDAGSYTDRNTGHTDSICVPKNVAYRFQINDSYSDGICCSYGLGNYQITVDGFQAVSAVGDFGSSEVQDLNGLCSTNIVVSDPPLKCSSVTRKQDCQGNCEWVGNGNKNGRCTLKPKEEPAPKCAACRSTGTSCCGSCVNNGPKWMRGCY